LLPLRLVEPCGYGMHVVGELWKGSGRHLECTEGFQEEVPGPFIARIEVEGVGGSEFAHEGRDPARGHLLEGQVEAITDEAISPQGNQLFTAREGERLFKFLNPK